MAASNNAAFLVAAKVSPLEVKPAPYSSPEAGEIVVKNAAIAINPVDWKIQKFAYFPMQYPVILGEDAAGEVVEVGSGVTRFKKGDRVLGHCITFATKQPKHSSFQEYTVLKAELSSPIPDSVSYEAASAIPLCLSTAASGMYDETVIKLNKPTLSPTPTGEVFFVWGGSSSVGVNAIQLAVAGGYEVITTASARNAEALKKLGASQVIDYSSASAVDDVLKALEGKTLAGAYDTINAKGAVDATCEIVSKAQGSKVVLSTGKPPENPPAGITHKFVFATVLINNGVGKYIYEDYLPQALAQGKFVASPEPVVVGKGLDKLQAAMDEQMKGVSMKKIVVSL